MHAIMIPVHHYYCSGAALKFEAFLQCLNKAPGCLLDWLAVVTAMDRSLHCICIRTADTGGAIESTHALETKLQGATCHSSTKDNAVQRIPHASVHQSEHGLPRAWLHAALLHQID